MRRGDYQTIKKAQLYYKKRFAGGLDKVHQDEIKCLNNWLKAVHAQRKIFLDIGAGTGRVTKALLLFQPKRIYALDQSEAMLKFFKKIYSMEIKNGKIKTIKATSDKTKLDSNSIDIITSFHLFKHLPKITPTIYEINKILKPHGYLIFDILNKNSLIRFNLGTCFSQSEAEVKNILAMNGFKIKEIKYLHIFGETVYGKIPYGTNIIHVIDQILNMIISKFGTKILVLAQKK